MPGFFSLVCSDFKAAYEDQRGIRLILRGITNSSLHACILVRSAQCSPWWAYWIWRRLLICFHAMDIGRGVVIGPRLSLPHPVSIVIGNGVSIGERCAIFQGVTLGRARDEYPRIGDGVTIYPNCVIVGGVQVSDGSELRAFSFITPSHNRQNETRLSDERGVNGH